MFNFFKRNIFYDEKKCKKIISKYTGDKNMQILRALSSGELEPNDIKKYHSVGYSGIPVDQEYILINNLSNKRDYAIKKYESGHSHSMLRKIELEIVNGNGIITEHWVCA